MENKEILCPMCKKHMAIILKEKAKIFGGVILIFIGLKIFIEHNFF